MKTQKMRDVLARLHEIENIESKGSKDSATRLVGALGKAGMNGTICACLQSAVNLGNLNQFRKWLAKAWDWVQELDDKS